MHGNSPFTVLYEMDGAASGIEPSQDLMLERNFSNPSIHL